MFFTYYSKFCLFFITFLSRYSLAFASLMLILPPDSLEFKENLWLILELFFCEGLSIFSAFRRKPMLLEGSLADICKLLNADSFFEKTDSLPLKFWVYFRIKVLWIFCNFFSLKECIDIEVLGAPSNGFSNFLGEMLRYAAFGFSILYWFCPYNFWELCLAILEIGCSCDNSLTLSEFSLFASSLDERLY